MRKFSLKTTLICLLLSLVTVLSGCNSGENVPEDTTTSVDTSEEVTTADEDFVALFGGEADYQLLKTEGDSETETVIQDFLSDLRSKIGKKDIFASSNYSSETDKEILIGNIDGREQSKAAMAELAFNAYSISFSGEKLLICAYTSECLEEALGSLLEAIYQAPSGEWGVSGSLDVYVDKGGVGVKIPKFTSNSARLVGTYISNDDRNQMAYSGAVLSEYTAYNEALTMDGFTLYSQNEIGENKFATYVNDTTEVHLIWFPAISSFRIVFGAKGYLPATTTPQYEKFTDCTVTQIGRYGAERSAAGESFIIQLEDGSYIIIDGGPGNTTDSENLLSFLVENKPDSHKKPRVIWMFTHLHSDHTELALNFLISKYAEIELTALCYNFPNLTTALKDSSCASTYSTIKALKSKHPNAQTLVFHTGQTMKLPGCEIEFLQTQEDYWPNKFSTANDTSATWRMNFEGGHSFLVLGDSEVGLCRQMTKIYGDYLRSDILQLSHHGANGATKELYVAVDPKICFWAIDEYRFQNDGRCLGLLATSDDNGYSYTVFADPENKTEWAAYNFNYYLRNTEWTRGDQTGARAHYSASRTVTVKMTDLSLMIGELLSE